MLASRLKGTQKFVTEILLDGFLTIQQMNFESIVSVSSLPRLCLCFLFFNSHNGNYLITSKHVPKLNLTLERNQQLSETLCFKSNK